MDAESITSLRGTFPVQDFMKYYNKLIQGLNSVPQTCNENRDMEDRISKVVEELHEKDWGLIESINSDKLRLATRDRILRVFKGQEKFLEGLFIAIHKDGTLYDSLKSEMERKDELEKLERELAPILKLINGIEENIESLNNLHNETYSQLKREEAAECILHDIRERYPEVVSNIKKEFQSLDNDIFNRIDMNNERYSLLGEYKKAAKSDECLWKFINNKFASWAEEKWHDDVGTPHDENDSSIISVWGDGGERYGRRFFD